MKRSSLILAILLAAALAWGVQAMAATFYTSSAKLTVGQKVHSSTSKNGNRTQFFFSEILTNPETKAKAAFVQWAPLMPKARAYRNGSLVDENRPTRVWINGIWFTLAFDGEFLHID